MMDKEVPMELAMVGKLFLRKSKSQAKEMNQDNSESNLSCAKVNQPYVIQKVETADQGIKDFLFTLGCFEGEEITVLSVLADNYIIHIKDARYSIDQELAKAILI